MFRNQNKTKQNCFIFYGYSEYNVPAGTAFMSEPRSNLEL